MDEGAVGFMARDEPGQKLDVKDPARTKGLGEDGLELRSISEATVAKTRPR